MGQVTAENLIMNLVTSYRLMFVAVLVGLIVELVCFRRVRRWNGWLTMLAGVAVCLQSVVVVILLTMRWEEVATYEIVLKVNALGFSGVALVALWLGVRRVWLERAESRAVLAWLRTGALILMTAAFSYQLNWGLGLLDLFSMAKRA